MANLLGLLRLLRMGESYENLEVEDDKRDLTIITSLALRDGAIPKSEPDKVHLESINKKLAADQTKVRISLTKIEMKDGAVRWQVSMKSTDPEGVESTDLNCWAPTVVAGVFFVLLKLLGLG